MQLNSFKKTVHILNKTSHYNDLQNKIFDFRNVKVPLTKTEVINVFEPDDFSMMKA